MASSSMEILTVTLIEEANKHLSRTLDGAMSFETKKVVRYAIKGTQFLLQASIPSSSLEFLIESLIEVLHEEYVLRRDLRKEAKKLQATLSIIQAILSDAEKKSIDHAAVKIWLRELEGLVLDADDVVDELNYHLLYNKVHKMKTLKTKVLSSSSYLNNMIARPRITAVKIQEINTDFMDMNTRANQFGILQNVEPAASFEIDSFSTPDPVFVGRDDDVDKLVDVVVESPHERKLSILAIVGMGGLGKTALTRKVFDHQRIKTRFGSLVWVHVSRTSDPIIIFNKILSSLTSHTVVEGVESEQMILKKLQEALKDKTYLLVLDDVWIEDFSKWNELMDSVSGVTSTLGNAIIITTRSTEVAAITNPLHTHTLKCLSDEDCWSIIKAKAFESGEAPSSGFEMIGKKIANRCQGLPLTARVVGLELYHCRSEEEWNSVEQKWFTDVNDYILKSLRKSYDHLPLLSLKKCFTYCSTFPKGRQIKKQELIEMWMAEGFLGVDGRNGDMEYLGEVHFDVLLSRSLLQQVVGGNVAGYVMHNLLHDVARDVLSSWTNAEGVSLFRYSLRDERSPILPNEVAKHLRTLILEGDISGTVFSDFESLHVLTLDSSTVTKLPSSIRELIHLRNLNISKTSIEKLPDWIGELHHLQTLRAEGEYLRKLPSTLKYLIKLRHLYIDDKVELPAGIGRLTQLRTLRCFRVGAKNGFKIEELGSLSNLRGNLTIDNLEKVGSKEEVEKARMSEKENLMELVLKWGGNREGETNDESVLEGLQPHRNITRLGIEGFNGEIFPEWLGSLSSLKELSIHSCKNLARLPSAHALHHLAGLQSLAIRDCPKLRVDPEWRNMPRLRIEVDGRPIESGRRAACSEVCPKVDGDHLENSIASDPSSCLPICDEIGSYYCEDDDSEEEYCIQRPAFSVSGVPDFN